MADTTDATAPELVCPHCKKSFATPVIEGGVDRYRGFKCPHCRLFVAADRVVGSGDDGTGDR